MAHWTLAHSLTVLLRQVNAQWPQRSRVSDGTIGDTEHASRPSDHNPNMRGVVTALDITHGGKSRPADEHGMDPLELADWLRCQADRIDLAWWQWLDANSTTYLFDEGTKTFRCCSGYFEHFDGCSVRTQIDSARRSLFQLDGDAEGCAGTIHAVNPDAPSEGFDIHHDGPCPAHDPFAAAEAFAASLAASVRLSVRARSLARATAVWSQGTRVSIGPKCGP